MRKAGRIALGEHDAGAAARAGKACLLLLAQDASDNARKRAEGFAYAAQAPLRGYGLRNVISRIRLKYGEAYGCTFESRLGEGTKVTVRIPCREEEE